MDTSIIKRVRHSINLICKNKPESLIKINCSLNNKTSIAIVDSGAICSIISERTCKSLGIDNKPSKRSIRVADENVCPVRGETETLKVKINNSLANIKFLVIPANHINFLLGLDWQRKVGAIINSK